MKARHVLLSVSFGVAAYAQVHVAPHGSDAGAGTAASPFLTINHAAAVVPPGGTIVVHAGSYGDEQGVVQLGAKDLVVQGDGAATTVLHPHAATTIALVPADLAAVAPVAHRVGVLCSGPSRVQLRDFTIDAGAAVPVSGHLAGLYLRAGADVTCERLAVVDCRPPASGAGLALAVAVRGDLPTDPTTLAARGCRFVRFGDGAVRALLRAELDLAECAIAGAWGEPGAPAQDGVLLAVGAVGLVRLSRLCGLAGAGGAAVRLADAGSGCVIEGNRIARAAFGVDVQRTSPALAPGAVRDNRIAAVDTAVRVRATQGLWLAGNSLFPASRFDPLPASDDSAGGNAWAGNRWAVPPGTTNVPVPGGGCADGAPRAGVSELGAVQRIACGGAPVAVVVADLDGDGHADFATLDQRPDGVGLSVGLWRPAGHLVTVLPFAGAGTEPVALVTGAFDAVPGVDLAALTAPLPPWVGVATFTVFANGGGGAMSVLHVQPLPQYVRPAALAAARLDGDPAADLVVVDQGAWPFTAGTAQAWRNGGSGGAWTATPLPVAFAGTPTAAATADVDGDGHTDVALSEGGPAGGLVHWLRGDGTGAFAVGPGSPFAAPADPRGVAIADADADGDRDVLVAATGGVLPLQRGAVLVLENRAGALVATAPQPTDRGPARLCVADLDADGFPGVVRPELLVLDLAAGDLALFGAWQADTGWAGGGLVTLADTPVDFAAGDLDGDDFGDVIVAEPARGGVALLHGAPTALVQTFGRGCPGAGGREPFLATRGAPGLPVQPNVSLQVVLQDALPLSFGVYAVALAPAAVLAPCSFLLAGADATWFAVIDSQGAAAINLPLPALPDVRGLPLCFQAGVYDPAAITSIFPGFSLTAGLRVRIGD